MGVRFVSRAKGVGKCMPLSLAVDLSCVHICMHHAALFLPFPCRSAAIERQDLSSCNAAESSTPRSISGYVSHCCKRFLRQVAVLLQHRGQASVPHFSPPRAILDPPWPKWVFVECGHRMWE